MAIRMLLALSMRYEIHVYLGNRDEHILDIEHPSTPALSHMQALGCNF